MENIIHELYHGNIRPTDGRFPQLPKYKAAAEEVTKIENNLLALLNDEGKELYRQLTLAAIPRDVIENAYAFEEAFKLGARIMLNCLTESGVWK